MDGDKILLALLNAMPVAVSVALMLGLGKVAADLLRHAAGKVRAHVKKTPTPIDDIVAAPLLEMASKLAADLEDNKIDGKPAAERAKKLAEELAKSVAKKK